MEKEDLINGIYAKENQNITGRMTDENGNLLF